MHLKERYLMYMYHYTMSRYIHVQVPNLWHRQNAFFPWHF